MLKMRTPAVPEVDDIIAGHAAVRPDLDFEHLHLYFQLHRISDFLDEPRALWAKTNGLTVAEISVLLALLRARPSYKLRPTDIHRKLLITTGAITKLLSRIERAGLIRRVGGQSDRRSRLVQLTRTGKAFAAQTLGFVNSILTTFEANAGLSKQERVHLAALLAKLEGGAQIAAKVIPPKTGFNKKLRRG